MTAGAGQRAIWAAPGFAAFALVVWIRILPLKLPALDDYAARTAAHSGAALASRLKSQLQYRGEDGSDHVYLGDFDSYYWLRMARNLVESGSPCDAMVNGECRDTLSRAPVGRRNFYPHSIHVYAIAGLYRLAAELRPGYPLPAAAFLVAAMVGALAVFPAFAIGQRLGGTVGGLCAALVIALNPLFLERSIGADNDVWNVTLPLCMVWALLKALEGRRTPAVGAFTALAAILAGIHSAAWSGWIFTYDAVLIGLMAAAAMRAARFIATARTYRFWQAPGLERIVCCTLGFAAVTALAIALIGGHSPVLALDPLRQLGAWPGRHPGGPWPDVLDAGGRRLVAEAAPTNLALIAGSLGGRWFFLAGCLGLLLAVMRSARGEDGTRGAVAWIVAAWFVAAIAVSFKGERFVMLAVAPFGLALAAAAGELYHLLHGLIKRAVRAPARLGQAGAFILAAAPLAIPVCNGYAAARNYVPEMNGAWWNTLARIREESPPDAIIDTWWDYGYWAEYVAGRRAAADGGAVRTHIPLWIAKALMAPSERQAARLLRMLNCGSDATPDAAGRQGAFGKLRAYGIGEVEAAETVAALAGLDRQTARDYLERRGLSGPARDDVLASTHCTPPPSYLVLSTAMNSISGWRYLGNWDLRRAGPQGSGSAGYAAPYWIPCAPSQGPEEMCFMGFDAYAAGSAHPEAVIVNARDPARTRLRMRDGSAMTAAHEIAPRAVLIAGPRAIEELRCTGRPCAELAVLIDPGKHRVLVGPPALIRSTYTRLMFLGGRYGRVFRKTGERRGYGGERVTAWRIDWDRLVYK